MHTGLPIARPIRVHEIKNGLVLLFIVGKGLFCIDRFDNLISLNSQNGFNGNNAGLQSAAFFVEGNDNTFWMAIPGLGLYEYGFEKNKLPFLRNYFTVENGLQSNSIRSIAYDKENRLWVGTVTGLDILQKNKNGNWDIFNYAKVDELGISDSYYEKLATDTLGNVWLSSPNKILKFNTANIQLHKEAPYAIIEKVSLAFKETDWNKLSDSLYSYYQLPYNPVLKYNQNSLGISFNAIDLSISNSSPQYSYKLLPLDTSWSIPSKIKSVSFAQLPSGKYQFIVRAKNMASDWSQPAAFKFTITAPFWNEWWFRLIIIGITSFIIIPYFQNKE